VEKSISAAEANRNFSRLLRAVKEGQTFVVTSHGIPVARIVPAKRGKAAVMAAKRRLLAHLRSQPIQILGKGWTRDELYDD
jgi:prevent-host-death family protein